MGDSSFGLLPTRLAALLLTLSFSLLLVSPAVFASAPAGWDEKGYIMFCPCMGRTGNQLDQFVGMVGFAKLVDRTLILPKFISYGKGGRTFTPYGRCVGRRKRAVHACT